MTWIAQTLLALLALSGDPAERKAAQECALVRTADGTTTITRSRDPALWASHYNRSGRTSRRRPPHAAAGASSSVSASAATGGDVRSLGMSSSYADGTGAIVTTDRDRTTCSILIEQRGSKPAASPTSITAGEARPIIKR
jgi:hypothetical protein